MVRFFANRIGLLVPTFLGVTLVTFLLIRLLPSDPVRVLAGEQSLSPAQHQEMMVRLGLDRPLWEQYLTFLGEILRGNFGTSLVTQTPVLTEFAKLFPATLELSICALFIAIVLGIPAGVIAAVRRGSIYDQAMMSTALAGYSMPIFWWALLLIIVFSGWLGWTPVSGRISLTYFFRDGTGFMLIDSLRSGRPGAFRSAVSHLILPSIVLATIPLAVIARQTRSALLEVLNEDYVRTARAKGLSPFRVVGLHALRNGMIPVVTTIGLQVGTLLGGAILTETIFSWPGIGKWMVEAIFRRDYQVVQGGLLLIAIMVMVVNLVVDMVYGLINPRIRHMR